MDIYIYIYIYIYSPASSVSKKRRLCTSMYICITCIHLCTHVHTCVPVHICVHLCTCVYLYRPVYVCTSLYTGVHLCTPVYLCGGVSSSPPVTTDKGQPRRAVLSQSHHLSLVVRSTGVFLSDFVVLQAFESGLK